MITIQQKENSGKKILLNNCDRIGVVVDSTLYEKYRGLAFFDEISLSPNNKIQVSNKDTEPQLIPIADFFFLKKEITLKSTRNTVLRLVKRTFKLQRLEGNIAHYYNSEKGWHLLLNIRTRRFLYGIDSKGKKERVFQSVEKKREKKFWYTGSTQKPVITY